MGVMGNFYINKDLSYVFLHTESSVFYFFMT